MMEFIVKVASTIVNAIMICFKVSDLIEKHKEKHQKSNRPDQG